MNAFSTEFEFILPLGYRDADGNLHKHGVMRLATAADEILPMKDHRVQSNPSYLTVIVLSRVIVRLGNLDMVTTKVIEDLFTLDFSYLQDFYNRINGGAHAEHDETAAPMPGMEAVAPTGKFGSL
jgi:hypothetical protein